MLIVTGRAKEELERIQPAKADNYQAIARLTTSGPDKYSLFIDAELPDDQVVEHKGSKVLLIEHELAASLEGYTLAFEDKKFIIAEGPLSGFNKTIVTFNMNEGKD